MFFKHMYIYLKYATISNCNISCFYYNIQVSFINNKKEIFFFFLSILLKTERKNREKAREKSSNC